MVVTVATAQAAHYLLANTKPVITMRHNFANVFGDKKPVIAMVHVGALPGAPLFDNAAGLEGLVEGARRDLAALQAAGFDAVMFGNENDRPYEYKVDTASTAAMATAAIAPLTLVGIFLESYIVKGLTAGSVK